jgi:hypothetical protein
MNRTKSRQEGRAMSRLALLAGTGMTGVMTLVGCASEDTNASPRSAPSQTPTPMTSASTAPGSGAPALYHGTFERKSSQSPARREIMDVGIYCAARCNLTGLSLGGQQVTILKPQGGGKFTVSMPAQGDVCDASKAPASALSGSLQLSGQTMTFSITATGEKKQCPGGVSTEAYAETYTFRGTLTQGTPPQG